MEEADTLIKKLNMVSHPEGGHYVEVLKNEFFINNLDINLICEQPKISKYRYRMVKSLSDLLNIHGSLINLKGKTVEKLGLIGKEKAIACEVICSISR